MSFNYRGPKICSCGSGQYRYELTDARGIFISYVCDECVDKTMAHYRPEIFQDLKYEANEPVDED